MRYESPSQLALAIRSEAQHKGGPASVRLSSVRGALANTLKYGWGPTETEFRSIARFAQDFGFEYLSLTTSDGHEICNFWLVPTR
jgi:hypothetical protein